MRHRREPTLRSLQLKGRVVTSRSADPEDHLKHLQYKRDFHGDIASADRLPIELAAAWGDIEGVHVYDVEVVEVVEVFDQTPGPRAGGRVRGES